MKIIISPAKKMQVDTDSMEMTGMPVYLEEAKRLAGILKGYSFDELKTLFAANEAITRQNYERYQKMEPEAGMTPAVLAYVGIQYQSMAPKVFTSDQWDYIKRHLNILSGLYGILDACDGILPYRLEMQARLPVDGHKDLYGFWGEKLYRRLTEDNQVIINLASKEYWKAVEPYLEPGVRFLTCVFGEENQGRVKVKATQAKMARGAMVRWMAEHQVEETEQIKEFAEGGYQFSKEYSSEDQWVFLHQG